MENLVSRIARVLAYFNAERQALLTQVADLKDQLAQALANDAADAEAVSKAQAEAAEARATADAAVAEQARLQEAVNAAESEEAAISALLEPVEAAIPAEA